MDGGGHRNYYGKQKNGNPYYKMTKHWVKLSNITFCPEITFHHKVAIAVFVPMVQHDTIL